MFGHDDTARCISEMSDNLGCVHGHVSSLAVGHITNELAVTKLGTDVPARYGMPMGHLLFNKETHWCVSYPPRRK